VDSRTGGSACRFSCPGWVASLQKVSGGGLADSDGGVTGMFEREPCTISIGRMFFPSKSVVFCERYGTRDELASSNMHLHKFACGGHKSQQPTA
jgi:hypothetical protein